jgi:RNA polymerase primary sigma factor
MKQLVINKRLTNRDVTSFNQYLKDISNIDMLTYEEEKALTQKTCLGDRKAIDELVEKNLRFVVSVAKQYTSNNNSLEDLVNEGNIGLIIAAEKFQPEMGHRFISYAVWWVRKIILEYLAKNSRLVRLPANKLNSLSKLEKKIHTLEQKLGRRVEINDLFGDDELTEAFNDSLYDETLSDDYNLLVMLSNNIDSMDREINNDEGNGVSLGDLMSSDEIFKESDYELNKTERNEQILSLLDTLKPREKLVMIALFGLDGEFPRTLKDIGDELNITREMVRQIRNKSLEKMKAVASEEIKSFL